ncbi:hypothetical protein [Thalassospira sp.]|uniref:hypothetical protein n=1 Tax=Thalassospira sp. TaxID=1912094 RepID=UPI003AA7CA19
MVEFPFQDLKLEPMECDLRASFIKALILFDKLNVRHLLPGGYSTVWQKLPQYHGRCRKRFAG